MGLTAVIQKLFAPLILLQEIVTSVLLIFLPVLVCIQVLLRYVFAAPLMGIEELMLFPIIWLYFIGGANASMERTHISCGILTLYIKGEISQVLFHTTKSLISVLVSSWLTYWAYWYFIYSWKIWKVSDLLYIPMFFGESAVFIGMLLMTLYSFVELMDYLIKFRQLRSMPQKEEIKC